MSEERRGTVGWRSGPATASMLTDDIAFYTPAGAISSPQEAAGYLWWGRGEPAATSAADPLLHYPSALSACS